MKYYDDDWEWDDDDMYGMSSCQSMKCMSSCHPMYYKPSYYR